MEATTLSQSASLSGAFQDLDAFAIKARDMLELARQFNSKLQAQSETLEPEEARLVRKSLMNLGLNSNSTATSAVGEEELVLELATVLQGSRKGASSLMKDHGIIGLDEIWGAWMRSRGVCTFILFLQSRTALIEFSSFATDNSPAIIAIAKRIHGSTPLRSIVTWWAERNMHF